MSLLDDLNHFMVLYEEATNSHDFSRVRDLLDDDILFWFNDGSYDSLDVLEAAFVKTWNTIQDEVYRIDDVEWLTTSDTVATCVYTFHWEGYVDGSFASGSGRGTNILVNRSDGWRVKHEHLSTL